MLFRSRQALGRSARRVERVPGQLRTRIGDPEPAPGRIGDRDVMLVTGGTVVARDREALRAINYQQPQAFVNLHCTGEGFVEQLRSNHIHMVYGQYQEHLKHLCRILDIDVVEPA